MGDDREDSEIDDDPAEVAAADDRPAEPPMVEGPTVQVPSAESPVGGMDRGRGVEQAIDAIGDRLSRQLDAIQTILEREARAEATRERVVDRLHAELQEYKQDLLLKVQRPIFVDLIQLHDDIGKMVAAQDGAEGEVARLLDMMSGFQQGIEDILYRQGVEPFALEGDAFDPRRQRALSTVPTDDPDRNKRVAARLRKGFQASDKLIRPEMVTVYSYKEKTVATPDQA